MTDEGLNQERETHIISLYSGTLHFLLLGVPVLGIALIGSAYWWDFQSEDSCNRLESMLDFIGSTARYYAGVLAITIALIPNIFRLIKYSRSKTKEPSE